MSKRKVLLLEPNYKNKYPPMGLMKLAMYYRLQGDDVVFWKGDEKDFIVRELTEDFFAQIKKIKKEIDADLIFSPGTSEKDWREAIPDIRLFIRAGKISPDSALDRLTKGSLLLYGWLKEFHRQFRVGAYYKTPRWDIVCVTTLFTFYWDITIETIGFAKKICRNWQKNLLVGGVLATVVGDELQKKTGVRSHRGVLAVTHLKGDDSLPKPFAKTLIDALPLDYSILEEVDYQYPEHNAFYGYMTRGCVNHCKFCVVPTLEPDYKDYIPLKPRVDFTTTHFGEQRDLLLLDNNVFASKKFERIIDDIRACGFGVGSTFIPPNELEIVIRQLNESWNDRAYLRRAVRLLNEYSQSVSKTQGDDVYNKLYSLLKDHGLLHDYTATKEAVLTVYGQIHEDYAAWYKRHARPVVRHIDFNQGLDARLATPEKMKKLATIAIRPLRIAFDDWSLRKTYVRAIQLAAENNIVNLSNYLLYNFKDTPAELYQRLLINVELSEALGVNIYSFPMKYHPITDPQWFSNRDFIGENWSRKYIRAVQCVLNSTHGKIGRGRTFFFKAFGRNLAEFDELLMLPESFIIKRWDAEIGGLTDQWRRTRAVLSSEERADAEEIVKKNIFESESWKGMSEKVRKFLSFYLITREEILLAPEREKESRIAAFEMSCPTGISDVCRELLFQGQSAK